MIAADSWWQLAETQLGLAQRNLRERAAALYGPHLERLTGFTRARALARTLEATRQDEFDIPPPPAPTEIRLLDLKPTSAWTSHGQITAGDREARLTSGPTKDTIFAHADSRIIYAVPKGTTRFRAIATTLDRKDDRATHFRFIVMTNTKKVLLETRELTTYPQHQVDIDIELPPDAEKLILITKNMWGHGMQWAVWAKPRFVVVPEIQR